MATESMLQTVIEQAPENESEAPRRAAVHHDGITQASPTSDEKSLDDVLASTDETSTPPFDAAEETMPLPPPETAALPNSVRHQCLICHKIFQSALKTHMNIHSNQRPFACGYPGCDSRFNARSNAVRHQHMHGADFVRSLEAEKRAAEERAAREVLEDGLRFAETIVAVDGVDPSATKGRAQYSKVRWMPTNQSTRHYAPYTSSLGQPRRFGRIVKGDASEQKRGELCFEDAPR